MMQQPQRNQNFNNMQQLNNNNLQLQQLRNRQQQQQQQQLMQLKNRNPLLPILLSLLPNPFFFSFIQKLSHLTPTFTPDTMCLE